MKQPKQKLGGWLVLPVLCVLMLFLPLCAGAQGYECEAGIPVTVELNGDRDEAFTVAIAGSTGAEARLRACALPRRATTSTP